MSVDRFISQNALITEIAKIHGNLNTRNVGQAIWDTPTADVVEVVRCKDCIARPQKYLEPFACARNNILVYGNSFCSYGKRRSENE